MVLETIIAIVAIAAIYLIIRNAWHSRQTEKDVLFVTILFVAVAGISYWTSVQFSHHENVFAKIAQVTFGLVTLGSILICSALFFSQVRRSYQKWIEKRRFHKLFGIDLPVTNAERLIAGEYVENRLRELALRICECDSQIERIRNYNGLDREEVIASITELRSVIARRKKLLEKFNDAAIAAREHFFSIPDTYRAYEAAGLPHLKPLES